MDPELYRQRVCIHNNPGHIKLPRSMLNYCLRISSVVSYRPGQLHKLRGPVKNELELLVQKLLRISKTGDSRALNQAQDSFNLGTCASLQVTHP